MCPPPRSSPPMGMCISPFLLTANGLLPRQRCSSQNVLPFRSKCVAIVAIVVWICYLVELCVCILDFVPAIVYFKYLAYTYGICCCCCCFVWKKALELPPETIDLIKRNCGRVLSKLSLFCICQLFDRWSWSHATGAICWLWQFERMDKRNIDK